MISKSIFPAIAAVLLLYSQAYAQEQEPAESHPGFKKNVVFATVGTVGLMGAYSLSYERMLLANKESSFAGLWARAATGAWAVWSSGGPYQSLMLGTMTGQKNSHFELNFGLARMVDSRAYDHAKNISDYLSEPQPSKSDYVNMRVAGSAGYRFQKPTSRFLFRAGAGYPETLYLGIGAAF